MSASRLLHTPWVPLRPVEQTDAELFERQLEQHQTGESAKFIAVDTEGHIAAFVNLNNVMGGVSCSANAGWSVSASFAGQGVATEAVGTLLDIAFSAAPAGLGLHRVACAIMPANVRSLRVAEKCGFRLEGYAKGLIRIAGRWEDHVLFAKLVEEHGVLNAPGA